MDNILDLFDLTGRCAIVAGGAGFLGQRFARTLASAGAYVVIADINAGSAETLAAEVRKVTGRNALSICTDITRLESVKAMAQVALETFGRVDILVNSAALDPKFDPQHVREHTTSFEDYPLELWRKSLDVDITGMFLCTQAVVPTMLAQGRGVIINVSSIYGMVGPDQRLYERDEPEAPRQYKPVTYVVTKAAVLGLTRYLATYYAGRGIRVNALTPGGVFNNHDEEFLKRYASRVPMGRMARVDELQGALLFLASDASSYMTGANLVVDGGWTAW
jgi:2-deoxy-D-gluconate 3-dehydrogenase